jgi:hypothetical protein
MIQWGFFFSIFWISKIWQILFYLENLIEFIILGKEKSKKKIPISLSGFFFFFSHTILVMVLGSKTEIKLVPMRHIYTIVVPWKLPL